MFYYVLGEFGRVLLRVDVSFIELIFIYLLFISRLIIFLYNKDFWYNGVVLMYEFVRLYILYIGVKLGYIL